MPGSSQNKPAQEVKKTDYVLIFTGVVALASMIVLYSSDKNILPQIVSTYTLQPVVFYNQKGLSDPFESLAVYTASKWYSTYGLHPMGAIKHSLGCFGEDSMDVFTGNQPGDLFTTMSGLQVKWDTNSSISVCTCLDHHTSLAMPQTAALATTIKTELEAVANRSRMQNSALHSLVNGLMAGNLFMDPTEAEFKTIIEIKDWCKHSAAPQYSLEFASVFNTKLLLLVALSLIFVSLDVLDVRKKQYNASDERNVWVWFLDIIPLIFFLVQFFRFQTESKMHTVSEAGSERKNSFLLVLSIITGGVSVLLLVLLTFFSKMSLFDTNTTKNRYNEMFERVFMDVPMVAGLSLLGIALKMQNAEHDETILFSTFVLLMAAGLVQHMSNLIKIVYDIVCSRLKPEVLHELQGASSTDPNKKEVHITKTRHILQYFGWTRLYGFGIVIVFAIFSFTLSSTSASTHNPLSIYTQNQYMYFVFIFITALTGLDFFYEVLPFVTEADTEYGALAADRLRKLSVLAYIIFVMVSQYTTESQEL